MLYTDVLKDFSSLFSVEGSRGNELYKEALMKFGLRILVDFASVEENCKKVLRSEGVGSLVRGPEHSYVIDVPGKGDCWLIAMLTPLLGFVIDERDEFKIVSHVRERLSDYVLEEPDKFVDIFDKKMDGLMVWARNVKNVGVWGGVTEMEVFARITGICVHIVNIEHKSIQPLTHILPPPDPSVPVEDSWGVSVVVEYGYSHYKCIIPTKFPSKIVIETRSLNSNAVIQETINVDAEDSPQESDIPTTSKVRGKLARFPKRKSQKERKRELDNEDNEISNSRSDETNNNVVGLLKEDVSTAEEDFNAGDGESQGDKMIPEGEVFERMNNNAWDRVLNTEDKDDEEDEKTPGVEVFERKNNHASDTDVNTAAVENSNAGDSDSDQDEIIPATQVLERKKKYARTSTT